MYLAKADAPAYWLGASQMQIRLATTDDIESVVSLRMRLFAETGETAVGIEVEKATRDFFSKYIASPTTQSWVAAESDLVVSVGTLAFFVRPPYPGNLAGREAYLLNMYTLPEYRRQGLAKAILQQAMRFAQTDGCKKVWLHASRAGRGLYESQGFRANDSYLDWAPYEADA